MQWSCLGSVLLFGLDARPSWAGSSRRHCLQGPCPPGSGTPNAKQPVVLSESGWRRHRHHLPSAISQDERLFVVVGHSKAAIQLSAVPGRSGSGHGRLCRIESGLAENRSWVRSPAIPARRKLCARASGSGGAAELTGRASWWRMHPRADLGGKPRRHCTAVVQNAGGECGSHRASRPVMPSEAGLSCSGRIAAGGAPTHLEPMQNTCRNQHPIPSRNVTAFWQPLSSPMGSRRARRCRAHAPWGRPRNGRTAAPCGASPGRATLLRRTPDRARKPGPLYLRKPRSRLPPLALRADRSRHHHVLPGPHAPIRPPAAAGSSSRPEADIIACCQNPMHQFAPPAAAGPFEQTGSRHHHVLPEPHAPIRAACAARQQPGQGNTPRPAGSCPIRAAHRLAPERT